MRTWQQEKHYLQSLILTIVSDYPLVFKGGTYLWLFHGLNRFSEDLDFTAKGTLKKDFPQYISRSQGFMDMTMRSKSSKTMNLASQ
jgi:predicted nucleotidyltransferase component of viral defense system